jgi:Protein of unknown function (DUF1203)
MALEQEPRMNAPDFVVIAIPSKVATLVRDTQRAPGYGHPAHTEIAAGYGPCRHCLRTFRVGEEKRTLFTYDPFHQLERIPLPGPIFIHADGCERYSPNAGYPPDMLEHAALLNAYRKGQELVSRKIIEHKGTHTDAVLELLADKEVDYIEVRDLEAGCFDFRIERRSDPDL